VNKIIPQTLKRAYGVHHSNLPNFSADEFSSSEVWMIAYKLLCYINVSFQNRSTVMHSTIKLIDLWDTFYITLCHRCNTRRDRAIAGNYRTMRTLYRKLAPNPRAK